MVPHTIRRAAVAALMFVSAVLVLPVAEASAATTLRISWSLPAGQYGVGVDHVPSASGGYEQYYEYPTSVCNNNAILPNPLTISSGASLTEARIEIYRGNYTCSSRVTTAGIALRLKPSPSTQNVGTLAFPAVGASNSGRFLGNVLSSSAITANRVSYSMFQTTGQPKSSTGYLMDAFTAGKISATSYATAPLWNGRYIVFITDNATGRKATGLLDIRGDTTYNIDLDAACFGIDECQWSGPVPNPRGRYHSVTPTRIVDTRTAVGISAAVKPGDGRLSDPNSVNRTAARVNHEFVVLGRGGVPTTGVSAVLANVTVTGTTGAGALRLFPKPARTSVFADQSSFPASNPQGPVAWFGAGDTRSTMQLLKVGVGGRVRVDNVSGASAHLQVDVVGWIDSTQPGQTGARVVPVTPVRAVDSRSGLGTDRRAFANTESRGVVVRDGTPIPTSAAVVLGNLTSLSDTAKGYDMVWPFGGVRPRVAAIQTVTTSARSNLAVSPTSTDGKWTLQHMYGNGHMVLDLAGYATTASGTGGTTQPVPITRLQNPTAMAGGSTRSVAVAGRAGVPASGAKGAWVQITASSTANGSLLVYPGGVARPTAATLQWAKGTPAVTMTLVPIGANGAINVYTAVGATVSVDIVGWVN